MLHKMGYEYTCAECERPMRDEDIGDPQEGLCIECHRYAQPVKCLTCMWSGVVGQLIVGNQLGGMRCPKCDMDDVDFSKPDDQ